MSIQIKAGKYRLAIHLGTTGGKEVQTLHLGTYSSLDAARRTEGYAIAHLNAAGLRRRNPIRDSRLYLVPKTGETVPAAPDCGFPSHFVARLRDASGPAYDYSAPFVVPEPPRELPCRPRVATLEQKIRQLTVALTALEGRISELESLRGMNGAVPSEIDAARRGTGASVTLAAGPDTGRLLSPENRA